MERLRVLVTDDEMGMRFGVERVLRDYVVHLPDINGEVRYTIDQAETGEEALAKIKASPPDILLLDHKLPGISGLDVLEQVAAMNNGMVTIMITAYASIETAVSATKRGAYDFLTKPFTPDELKDTVRKASAHFILMRRARNLAEEKRQVRFQFISVLAHELKAPLNAIEGYLQIVKDRSAGEDPAVYDKMIERSLVRVEGMRKMILDLLDMTRIEAGNKKRDFTEVDIVETARAVIDDSLLSAQERGISVALHALEPVKMRADRGEIEIILNNLVSNAVKYNRDGGRVDVTIGMKDNHASIIVADTGIGMSAEEAARLFNDFVRIKNEKTRNIMGSGLGLSIVRKLAQLYGGTASISSRPDHGSTFSVVLPLVSDSPAPSQPAANLEAVRS